MKALCEFLNFGYVHSIKNKKSNRKQKRCEEIIY